MKFLHHKIKTIADLKPFINDDRLDLAIAQLTDGDVETWKKEHYSELRAMAYPDIAEYLDGVVKDDADKILAYKEKCLAVKGRFKKNV